jgi:putative hemolysin
MQNELKIVTPGLRVATRIKAGMTNPAATYCENNGGRSIIAPGPGGETGYCMIDEWKMFNLCNPPSPMPLLQ